jgi:SAM-dependent methyltransferase
VTPDAIAHNQRAHDALGAGYDRRHPEIFNDLEQSRLRAAVVRAVEFARGGGHPQVRALDVGCGTGNLSGHLIDAGAIVTAADLSSRFLSLVRQRFGPALDSVQPLNGRDLQPVRDGTYALVAAYSVLHHIPDYLSMVREMARVAAPGGVIMIDHEWADEYWTSGVHAEFIREAIVWPPRRWWYFLQPSRYWKHIRPLLHWQRWGNPRWMPEGDLHIWPDDHIEWARVEAALVEAGCEIVVREPYLHFEPRYRRDVWERWRAKTFDMRLLIARKAA